MIDAAAEARSPSRGGARPGRAGQQRRDRQTRRRSSSSRWTTSGAARGQLVRPVAMIQAFLPLIRRGGWADRECRLGRRPARRAIQGRLQRLEVRDLEAVSDALRLELRQWKIHVSHVDPGRSRQAAIFGKTLGELDRALEMRLRRDGPPEYEAQIAAIRKSTQKAEADADPAEVIAEAVASALTAEKPKTKYLVGHGGKESVRGGAPRPAQGSRAGPRVGTPKARIARVVDGCRARPETGLPQPE